MKFFDKINFNFLIIFLLILTFLVVHEFTHVNVAKDFGCEASVDWIPDQQNVFTTTTRCENISQQEWLALKQAQSNVEAVGYQLAPVYTLIVFLVYWVKVKT